MYIGIPLLLIGVSALGILIILVRRFSHIQKFQTVEVYPEESLWESYFPEFIAFLRGIKFAQARKEVLTELEKMLRKIRIFILAIERISDSMIQRIRRVQRQHSVKQEMQQDNIPAPAVTGPNTDPIQKAADVGITNIRVKEKVSAVAEENVRLYEREKEIISSLSQNPKNFQLYRELGDIYMKLENWSDAKESLQTALQLKRDDKELANQLSSVLEKLMEHK